MVSTPAAAGIGDSSCSPLWPLPEEQVFPWWELQIHTGSGRRGGIVWGSPYRGGQDLASLQA